MKPMKSFDSFMLASRVKRFHTVPIIGEQTVGEHTYRMILILYQITAPTHAMLYAAMYHDTAEIDISDVSFMTKREWPKVSEALNEAEFEFNKKHGLLCMLKPYEHRFLKYADMAELTYYAIEQITMGNRNMVEIAERGLFFLKSMPFLNLNCSFFTQCLEEKLHHVR